MHALVSFQKMGVACNNLQTFDTMFLQSIDNLFPFLVILGWYLQSLSFLSISQTSFFGLYLDVYIYVFRASFDNVEYHSHHDVLVSKRKVPKRTTVTDSIFPDLDFGKKLRAHLYRVKYQTNPNSRRLLIVDSWSFGIASCVNVEISHTLRESHMGHNVAYDKSNRITLV